jgi:GNAT superfamily N-acetyltransferase
MTPEYTLEPVERLSLEATGTVRKIYEGGFAPHLRADFGELTTGRQPGEFALALAQAGQPAGFAMLRPLGDTGWVFLRYFVVDAERRGGGLGGIFWDLLTTRLADTGYSLLVFDVEDPAEPGIDQAELQIRNRRISFYQRHGASLLPVSGYRTPHDDAGDPAGWTPMRLMDASLGSGGEAAAPPVSVIVSAVYRYRWQLAPDHPQVTGTVVTAPE